MTITPAVPKKDLEAAEKRWLALRDAGSPDAAEAEQEFQRLARAQTEDLQLRLHQQMISRMLK